MTHAHIETPDGQADAGFTLVEMLVSLTLLAMAAALTLTALSSARMLWRDQSARTEGSEAITAAQEQVRGLVERLRPDTVYREARAYADVQGEPDSLTFVAPALANRPAGARRYRIARGEDGALMLSASADAPDQKTTHQALLTHVGALSIDYFGLEPASGVTQWQSSWKDRATAPELIRIKAVLAGKQAWPDLLIRPAVTLDTLCSIDPVTGACRGQQ